MLSDNFRKIDNSRNTSFQCRGKDDERPNKSKGIPCHECEGYEHIRPECPTFLKKQKKGMMVTWSDEESEDGSEDITANIVITLTVKSNGEEESSDGQTSGEEAAENYED